MKIQKIYILLKKLIYLFWELIFLIYYLKGQHKIWKYYEKIENSIKDDDLKDLLKKLIVIDAHKRIDWNDYFNHPFFNIDEIDFDKIANIKK